MSKPKMKRLVIDRKRWIRGEGFDDSYLYRGDDGKKCCVGFYARQLLRLPVRAIKDVQSLDMLLRDVGFDTSAPFADKVPKWGNRSPDIYELYTVNDNRDMDSRKREIRITKIFGE